MNRPAGPRSLSHTTVSWLGPLYVLFVVYGSLVPLQYVGRPLDEAILAFQNIPFLSLGVESRADWIANGVLYVPVGFLTALWLAQAVRRTPGIVTLALAGVMSVLLAVAVEFVQLYFPPRTVSLNDLLAESLGTVIGLVLAARYANWFEALQRTIFGDAQRSMRHALQAYTVAYLAFALFPFDFLLSWSELASKVDSGAWGWLVASNAPPPLRLALQLGAEIVLTLPFGLLLAHLSGGARTNYRRAALAGLLLGGLIEGAQFFLFSGVAQGLSVLTRVAGVCGGLAISQQSAHWTSDRLAALLRRYAPALAVGYLLALLEINGWLTSRWQGVGAAVYQLDQLSLIPFYYHYYTTEAKALFSLAAVCFSYVPVGLLAWAYRRSAGFALASALLLATVMEMGKLFLPDAHPDLTNILLASVASGWTVRLMVLASSKGIRPAANDEMRNLAPVARLPVGLIFVFSAVAFWVSRFPAFPVFVGVVLIASAAMVWRRPVWVFALLPAALPILDLAPWSGRFFLDEFDALLLVALTIAYNRAPPSAHARHRPDLLFATACILLALSFAISMFRGLMPLALPELNSFNNYFSSYNALRIGKGALEAALIFGVASRFAGAGLNVRRPLCVGMVVGLGLTVAAIAWERLAFSALWNFADGYRVTGPFSATHTGGAYADTYLAVAIPFLIILTLETRRWLFKLIGVLLTLAAAYALLVTFSRGGILALAVALASLLLFAVIRAKRAGRQLVWMAVLIGAAVLVAVPILRGTFAQSRISEIATDLTYRRAQWADAMAIRDADWMTTIFGMGLGRFPETKYWRSTLDAKVGTYRLEREGNNTYLRLGSGDAIGLDQFVAVKPGQQYVLKFDVRPSIPNVTLSVPICEKWLLTSAHCDVAVVDMGPSSGSWRSAQAQLTTAALADRPWYGHRPVKLSLTYGAAQSTVDVDNVRLLDERGIDLLRNGDFSQGLDHWLMAASGTLHGHWRVHSLFYSVLFDQGWFGLLALGGFLGLALARAGKKAWQGDSISAAAGAALMAFIAAGLFDTQIDAPRFWLLLLLLAWLGLKPKSRSQSQLPST